MGRRVGSIVVVLGMLAHNAAAEDTTSKDPAPAAAAPDSEPKAATTEVEAKVDAEADDEGPPVWRGFHVDLVTSDLSGLDTSAEAYENQLSFSLEPSYDLGERLLAKTWAKK